MSALSVRGLHVRRGGVPVLQEVDLEVAEGEWVGVIGPNGAGKTTLLDVLLGLVAVERGEVEVLGRNGVGLSGPARARLLASVPQRPVVPPDMRVVDYVLLGRTPHIPYLAGERREDLARAIRAMDRLGLAGLAGRRLGALSGGEVQQVVLARALAQGAPVLLLDEPTSALDVGHQQQVLGLVDEMREQDRLTVVSALHDLTQAARFCDRLVMLSRGRVVAEGRAVSVLTEARIGEHYGAEVEVLEHREGGVVVIPLRPPRPGRTRGTMAVEP